MITVSEKGLFLKENYELCIEYDTELGEPQERFLEEVREWNRDDTRFAPEKVCAIFEKMRTIGVTKKGTLARKECYLCTGIDARYEEGNHIRYHLKGVPDAISTKLLVTSNKAHTVVIQGDRKSYVFLDSVIAKEWKKLKSHKVLEYEWERECDYFLYKQIYSRENLAKSFLEQNIPLYVIRPGFQEAEEFIEPYYCGIAMNGSMDNFCLTLEEYLNIYKKNYEKTIVRLDNKLCVMNFDKNLNYMKLLYQYQKFPNSDRIWQVLTDALDDVVCQGNRWEKQVCFCGEKGDSIDSEDMISIVRENIKITDSLIIITGEKDQEKWKKYFPEAQIGFQGKWEPELENKPVVFVWACEEMNLEGYALLTVLLRFLPVKREYFFLKEEFAAWENEKIVDMEKICYVSGLREAFEEERTAVKYLKWRGDLVLHYAEEGMKKKSASDISVQSIVCWIVEHLELYDLPSKWREKSRIILHQGKDSLKSESWYVEFTEEFQNNIFMYTNGISIEGAISSSAFDAYFIPVGRNNVPLGFLKSLYPDWQISQRARIYEWLKKEEEIWDQYLNVNFIEFYSVRGESIRLCSDELRFSQLNTLGKEIMKGKVDTISVSENSMYAMLNGVIDIL